MITNRLQPKNRKGVQNQINEQKKHVKYMWIGMHKNKDSIFYDKGGIRRNNRIFSYCIMTDDNEFYYVDKRTLPTSLSGKLWEYLKKTLVTPFKYDSKTEVIMCKSITDKEPIFIVMDLLRSQNNFTINVKEPEAFYSRVNTVLNLHPNWNVFGVKKMKKLFHELKDSGYMTFVPEKMMLDASLTTEAKKMLFINSVMAMIYMFYRNNLRGNNCPRKIIE